MSRQDELNARREAIAAERRREAATPKPKHGDLKVWHIPQIPGKPFTARVATLIEAKVLLDALAEYDLFQLANRIKPDYSNAAGLSVFDANDKTDGTAGSWIDWHEAEEGKDIDDFELEELRTMKTPPVWEMEDIPVK